MISYIIYINFLQLIAGSQERVSQVSDFEELNSVITKIRDQVSLMSSEGLFFTYTILYVLLLYNLYFYMYK